MFDPLSRRALDLRDAIRLAQRDLGRLAGELRDAQPRMGDKAGVLEQYGAAALVQGYYTLLERVFERIARDLNSAPIEGPDWHRRLLRSMSLEREGVRPALLAEALLSPLDELLRFRHLFRNLYVLDLDPHRVAGLVAVVLNVHEAVNVALDAFVEFLQSVARAVDE